MINEESKDGNDGDGKALYSESSDSGLDDNASGSNDEAGKGPLCSAPRVPVQATQTPPAATLLWRQTR